MILKAALRSSFANIKQVKVTGNFEGEKIHFKSGTTSHSFQLQNPLETLLSSLAGCQLFVLRALSTGSNLKIKSVNFTKIEGGLDWGKLLKGGPDTRVEDIRIQAQIQTNVTQEQLDKWIVKAENHCPTYQMLTKAGVKISTKWTNVQSLP